jgi:hypothetical protein
MAARTDPLHKGQCFPLKMAKLAVAVIPPQDSFTVQCMILLEPFGGSMQSIWTPPLAGTVQIRLRRAERYGLAPLWPDR